MDWLNDKKNQPIIAAVAAVVIVGVGVLMWLTMFKGSDDEEPAPATETTGAEQMSMSEPSVPSTGAPAGLPTGPQIAAAPTGVQPMETWREDPFLPVGYKPPPGDRAPNPPIPDFPFFHFPPPPKPVPDELKPEPSQPVRRLAGVMINDRVYAIIEWNGKSDVYQPGQRLRDGLAVVEKIEPDKVTLKTTSEPSRYLVVRLASAPRGERSAAPSPAPGEGPGPGSRRRPDGPGRRPIPGPGM